MKSFPFQTHLNNHLYNHLNTRVRIPDLSHVCKPLLRTADVNRKNFWMPLLTILVAILLPPVNLLAQPIMELEGIYKSRDYLSLVPKAKNIRIFDFTAKKIDGKVYESAYPFLIYSAEYDSKGRMIRERTSHSTPQVWYLEQSPINPNEIPPDTTEILTTIWNYDGEILKSIQRHGDGWLYNETQLIENGDIMNAERTSIKVDPNTQIPNPRLTQLNKVQIMRDSKGRVTERRYINAVETFVERVEKFEYLSGNQISKITVASNGDQKVYQYSYQADGLISKIQSGDRQELFTFQNGRLIRRESKYGESLGNYKEFSYDTVGRISHILHNYPTQGMRYDTSCVYEDESKEWKVRTCEHRAKEGEEVEEIYFKITKRFFD